MKCSIFSQSLPVSDHGQISVLIGSRLLLIIEQQPKNQLIPMHRDLVQISVMLGAILLIIIEQQPQTQLIPMHGDLIIPFCAVAAQGSGLEKPTGTIT